MPSSRVNARSQRLHVELLAGWLFADLLLALFIIFMGTSRGEEPEPPPPAPPAAVSAPTVDEPAVDALLNNDTVVARGSSADGSIVEVAIGDDTCSSFATDGEWSCVIDDLGSGVMALEAKARSVDGTFGDGTSVAFEIDQSAPEVAIDSPAGIGNGQSYEVTGTCSENGEPVLVEVAGIGTEAICDDGRYVAEDLDVRAALTEGIVVTAQHSDRAGNSSSAAALAPTPRSGLEDEPEIVLVTSSTSEATMRERIRDALDDEGLRGRRAGLVLVWGSATQPNVGVGYAENASSVLADANRDMFGGVAARDLWSGDRENPNGTVKLEIYYFVE